MEKMTNWRSMLLKEIGRFGDTLVAICVGGKWVGLDSEEMLKEFCAGCYGDPSGVPFTAWGVDRVYFPLCYDGAESIGSAPRAPKLEALEHQGGW